MYMVSDIQSLQKTCIQLIEKRIYILDLTKSGRSSQYFNFAGTGPEPELEKVTGSTGTGYPVAVSHTWC